MDSEFIPSGRESSPTIDTHISPFEKERLMKKLWELFIAIFSTGITLSIFSISEASSGFSENTRAFGLIFGFILASSAPRIAFHTMKELISGIPQNKKNLMRESLASSALGTTLFSLAQFLSGYENIKYSKEITALLETLTVSIREISGIALIEEVPVWAGNAVLSIIAGICILEINKIFSFFSIHTLIQKISEKEKILGKYSEFFEHLRVFLLGVTLATLITYIQTSLPNNPQPVSEALTLETILISFGMGGILAIINLLLHRIQRQNI